MLLLVFFNICPVLSFFLGERAAAGYYGGSIATPDMEDVKDSVKQGVNKVAGRLSNMASGVMSQLQVIGTRIFVQVKSPSSKSYVMVDSHPTTPSSSFASPLPPPILLLVPCW